MTLAEWFEENPHSLRRWDNDANAHISIDSTSYGSHKKAWWTCANGHRWQARIDSVTCLGSGCPYCGGKKPIKGENDLETASPDLASQWCYEKNVILPDQITAGSKKKTWWKCELGHTWQATTYSRGGKQNAKCPYCANYKVWVGFNDLKTTHPQLASEWCNELNGELKPTDVMHGSHKKVWWQCEEGHVWEAFVFSRSKENGTGCPICSGRYKIKK